MKRTFVLLLLLASLALGAAPASAYPLFAFEARLGGGAMIGSGRGESVLRPSRFTLGILGEVALRQDPWVTAWGEILMEALHTVGLGLRAGARIYPLSPSFRVTLGIAGIVAPSTLGGASMALGYCYRGRKHLRLCFDVDGIFYFVGNDLPSKRMATQLQAQVAVGFDAL